MLNELEIKYMQNNNIFKNIWLLTAVYLVLAACSANNDQLVALWTLDEITEQKVKDSSKNGVHGTCIGNPEVDVNEGINGAIKFDGEQDYIKIEKEDIFDLTHAITVAAWIKVNEFNKNWQAIVTKGDDSWRIARDVDKNSVQFALNSLPKEQILRSQININDGKWHHVAGVYDGEKQKMYLYIDGQLELSGDAPDPIHENNEPVLIGENSQATGRFWNGWIDEVRIYSRPLTTNEIAELYARHED